MQFTPAVLAALAGRYSVVKAPARSGPPAQRDPAVIETVSRDARRRSSQRAGCAFAATPRSWTTSPAATSNWTPPPSPPAATGSPRSCARRIELGADRTELFAQAQREHLVDFETELVPGLVTGQRYVPVQRVGAYLPAGRFPMTASAFMTVNVAKVAGVPTVLACTPPQPDGGPNPAVLYAAYVSGR